MSKNVFESSSKQIYKLQAFKKTIQIKTKKEIKNVSLLAEVPATKIQRVIK